MNRMILIQYLLLPLFFFCFSIVEAQEPLCLSLKDAEDLAIQNNFQLNASLHRLEQGYFDYRASKAYFNPKVTVSSSFDLTRDKRAVQSAVQVTRPLLDRVAFYDMKGSQIKWEILRLEVQQQICDLLFQIRNAYFTLLLHQTHLAVEQMIIQLWEDELKRHKRKVELGVAIPFEFNQTNLNLKLAWIDYYATQSDMKTAQIKFLTILGLSPSTEFNLIEKEVPLPPVEKLKCPLQEWMGLTFQYRPQLKQEQLTYLLSKNKICQRKAEQLPTLSLYANAGHDYINNGFDNQPRVAVGINLDWTLYDPTLKARVNQAREGRREAASNYFQVELETEAIIHNILNELEKSNFAYLTAQEGVMFAEEGMKMAVKKHQLGMMSSFEYRDSIKALHQAYDQLNQAKFEVRNSYYRLIQESGIDLMEK